ncbi:MAG: HlyD family efflux transporter periplasmic adaptor subunit [Microthrixaceae bacterium]
MRTPIDGVVLYRSVEPGEVAAPGAPLITVADLDHLTLTVYVPEDRYGQIMLGQSYSGDGRFVSRRSLHRHGQPHRRPRRIHPAQRADDRQPQDHGLCHRLDLAPSDGKLKPGMPADVNFGVDWR